MAAGVVVIPKAWRSEAPSAFLFAILCPAAYYLTVYLPFTVVTGPLFELQGMRINLSLPLAIFLPAAALFQGIYRIYNVRYAIGPRGIEARHGILNLSQRVVKIRFEDIRAVEVKQSLLDRLLDIGNVELNTAASGDSEVVMSGIAAPYNLRQVVQLERDKRQAIVRRDRQEGLS